MNQLAQLYTQECMASEGFEYKPEPLELYSGGSIDFRRRDEVEKVGFGIADFDLLLSTGPDVDSPNQETYFGLDPATQSAWDLALEDYSGDNPAGCRPIAFDRARTELGINDLDRWYDQAVAVAVVDPAVVTAQTEWSGCVAQAGLGSFRSEDELYNALVVEKDSASNPAEYQLIEIEKALVSFDCGASYREARSAVEAVEFEKLSVAGI